MNADQDMLEWLITNAALGGGKERGYFGGLFQAAIAFRGDEKGVRCFLLSRSAPRRALFSRLFDAGRVRREAHENDAAPASATGRDAAVDGASAPRPVATPSPIGTIEGTGDASSLNLNMVRRIRAGHLASAEDAPARW
ncbi:MAG: hypothetical protein QOJ15_6043 [Bradyrhizobium sp.]|nr:hypothetical protein [Bradyrhizobium sp.]